jgi:hypothetical protein
MKNKASRAGTKSVKSSLPLALLLLCAALPTFANESSMALDHYKAADKAIQLTFFRVYEERIDNWKIVALLGKCKNEGLAKAVADKVPPLKDEIGDGLMAVLGKEKSLYNLAPDDFGMIHAAVANTIAGYKLGLSRGLDFVFADKGAGEALCRIAVKKADEYLAK